jgi:hypothetical protein
MDNENKLKEQEQVLEASVAEPTEIKLEQSGRIVLARNKRCWVFAFIIAVNIFINFDHGYFPAATEEFKKDFNMNSSMLGLFGSAVYFGNLLGKYDIRNHIGSFMVISIIDRFNRKFQFIFFLFLNSVALYTFTLYYNTAYGICNRVVVGFTQVSLPT